MNRRIDNVVRGLIAVGVRQGEHVGVLMETRPSALVAIAALSRLGAVAVLLQPDADLAATVRLGGVTEIITDPTNLEIARQLPEQILVLGGGESRDLHLPDDANVIDMEKIDPDAVELPAWYRPNPGYARDLAFIGFSTASGQLVAKQITNYRWALSAFGTASAAALGRTDTVYCLTPLHHESALLVSLGGAVVGGTRIALSRGLQARAIRGRAAPIRRHRRLLYLGHVARRHRRPRIRPARQSSGAACSSAPVCRPVCGSASSTCSRPRMSSSSSRPPTAMRCWPTCPAPRSAARAGRCRARDGSNWAPMTPSMT